MEVESSSKDEERSLKAVGSGGDDASPRRQLRKRRNIYLVVSAVGLVSTIIILVILSLTVFKAKDPKMTVDSIVLKDFDVALDMPRLSVDMNLTLGVDLSVKNPNHVSLKYTNSTAFVNYSGALVGEALIAAGQIGSDRTKPMNLTLTILADRILKKSELFSDVVAGALPLSTLTKISGKVKLFGIFKFHVVSTSSCDFTIFVSNKTIGEQHCKYKTKL